MEKHKICTRNSNIHYINYTEQIEGITKKNARDGIVVNNFIINTQITNR